MMAKAIEYTLFVHNMMSF